MSNEQKGFASLLISSIYSSGGDHITGPFFALAALVFFVLDWRKKDEN